MSLGGLPALPIKTSLIGGPADFVNDLRRDDLSHSHTAAPAEEASRRPDVESGGTDKRIICGNRERVLGNREQVLGNGEPQRGFHPEITRASAHRFASRSKIEISTSAPDDSGENQGSPSSNERLALTTPDQYYNASSSFVPRQRSQWTPPGSKVDSHADGDGILHSRHEGSTSLAKIASAASSVTNDQHVVRNPELAQENQSSSQFSATSGNSVGTPAASDVQSSKYWRGHVTIVDTDGEIQTQHQAKQRHCSVDKTMEGSPITRAIIRGQNILVLESLRQGENPNALCSLSGQCYLHLISWQASGDRETLWVPMIYQLSNAGANMNVQDKRGLTAASVAVRRKLVQVLAAMLKCGAELSLADLQEAESVRGVARTELLEVVRRLTPGYWQAVLDPAHFKVSRLVKAWARINISRPGGETLIEFAKQNASEASGTVDLLLRHEASIELAHAVMAGDSQRARVLLCNGGADLHTADFSVRSGEALNSFSPLSLKAAAEKYGHGKVLRLLQAREAAAASSSSSSRSSLPSSPVKEAREVVWHHGDEGGAGIMASSPKSSPAHSGKVADGGYSAATSSALCIVL